MAWGVAPITTQGFDEVVEACNNAPTSFLTTVTAGPYSQAVAVISNGFMNLA